MADLPRPLPPPTLRDRVAALVHFFRAMPRAAAVGLGLCALVGTTALLVIVAGLRVPAGGSGPPPELTMERADGAPAGATTGAVPTTTAATLRVHAAGAVARPGVVDVRRRSARRRRP